MQVTNISGNSGSASANEAEYPDYFARFYDLIYHQMRDGVDNDYYLKKVSEAKGKVLEVGVGTGRLFITALRNGADIYGIDISPAMLEEASKKLPLEQCQRISLQNILNFNSENKFSLIIAPFRVFMHLTNKEDQLTALNNVFDNLAPGGSFIFDAFVPDLNLLLNGFENFCDFDGEYEPGNRLKRIISSRPDVVNQIIYLIFRFEWNDKKSSFSREWRSSLRFFFRFELEHLIERSKFNEYKIFGDFNENELVPESKEFIVLCRRTL